jgi:hypothetical protein
MEPIDHLDPIAKDLCDGRKEGLGHIQHYDFNQVTFILRAAVEPGDDILGAASLDSRTRLASVQVDYQCIVTMALAPGLLINAKGSAKLARTATLTPLKGPAKHGAFRETIAPGSCATRAAMQVFLPYLRVKSVGPFHPLAEGLAGLPGAMAAIRALKSPQMQPQQNRAL